MRIMLAAAACALACALSAAAAHAQTSPAAPAVTQAGGVTVITQNDPTATLVDSMLVLHAGLDRQTMAQNGLAALTAQTILETPVNGVPLAQAIESSGGSIDFAVDPTDVRIWVSALPVDAPATLDMLRRAIAAPSFTAATVNAARSTLETKIAQNQQLALQVGLDMLNGTTASSANAGLPAFGVPAALAQIGPEDVRSFYAQYYRRSGAYVSVAGRVDALEPTALATFAQTLPVGETTAVHVMIPRLQGTSRQLVAHRDVPSPWLIAQYPAPQIGSKDFGPMLVLSAFMQRTLSDISEVPGVVSPTVASRAVGALYQYDSSEPNLTVYVNGGVGDANRAFSTALSIASILAATKLEGSIDTFKALATGDFLNSTSTLDARAWLAVAFVSRGFSADYEAQTLQAIDNTNASDLQRVAREYLGNPTIALVLPREKS
jgi:predicted Zn-dependent peptidase